MAKSLDCQSEVAMVSGHPLLVRDSASLATGICVWPKADPWCTRREILWVQRFVKGNVAQLVAKFPARLSAGGTEKVNQKWEVGERETAQDELVKLRCFYCSLYWWFLSSMSSSEWPNFTTNMNFIMRNVIRKLCHEVRAGLIFNWKGLPLLTV